MINTKSIQVTIYGRPYRVKVKPDEQDAVANAVKKINELVTQFAGSYDGDVQDFMAMTALYIATEHNKINEIQPDQDFILQKLNTLSQLLDN